MPFIHFNIRLLWNSWGLCQRLCFGICWRWSLTQFCHLTRLQVSHGFTPRPGLGWLWVIFPQTRWCAGWRTRRQQPHKLSATGQELGSSMLFSSRIGSSIEKEHHHAMMLMQNAVSVNDLWTKHMKSTVSISREKTMSWNQLQILENIRLFWHPIFTLAGRSGWMPFWSWEWRRLLGMPVVHHSLIEQLSIALPSTACYPASHNTLPLSHPFDDISKAKSCLSWAMSNMWFHHLSTWLQIGRLKASCSLGCTKPHGLRVGSLFW